MKYMLTHSYPEKLNKFSSDECEYIIKNQSEWKVLSFSGVKTTDNKNIIYVSAISGLKKSIFKTHNTNYIKSFAKCFCLNPRELFIRFYSFFLACDIINKVNISKNDKIFSYWLTRPSITAYFIKKITGASYACQGHGSDIYIYPTKMLNEILEESESIITIGEKNSEHLISNHPEQKNKIKVFKLGSNIKGSCNDYADRKNKIVFIGRLEDVKGVDTLLSSIEETYNLLLEKNYTIEIYGSGSKEQLVKDFANNKKIVEYFGWADKNSLKRIFSESKAILLPSKSEGIPVIIMEAFSHGVPAIANDVGGVSEIVIDGVTGLLNKSPEKCGSFSKKIINFINYSECEKEELSKNAYLIFEKDYSLKNNLHKKYEYLNNEALN